MIASKLIDAGTLDPRSTVATYLPDFEGSAIGGAPVQSVLDMTEHASSGHSAFAGEDGEVPER